MKIIFDGEVLPIEKQIEILELAKQNLLADGCCICSAIDSAMTDCGFEMICNLNTVIPLFTFGNAIIASKIDKFEAPNGSEFSYWWDQYAKDRQNARVSFVNWILNKLKKELNETL